MAAADMKRTKCVHMTSAHKATDVRILYKECTDLAEAGYQVVLVAPAEKDAKFNEVQIRAVRRGSGRISRGVRTGWQVYRAARREDAEIYHFHDPELIGIGLLLKLAGKRVVYDAHEDVPKQTLSKDYLPLGSKRLVAKLVAIAEAVGARMFDGIVTATPAIARRFPVHKTAVVQNFPRLEEFSASGEASDMPREPLLVYVGGIAEIRGIREMVRAMSLLPESSPARLTLAGTFDTPDLETAIRESPGAERTEFPGWQSREEVGKLLTRACAGLVLFHPLANHLESQPTKLFEYMAGGLPVIASDFPYWREIVEGAQCGLLVDPLDPQKIADAVEWMLQHPQEARDMGKRGREAAHTKYNWHTQGKILVEFYEGLAKGKKSRNHAVENGKSQD